MQAVNDVGYSLVQFTLKYACVSRKHLCYLYSVGAFTRKYTWWRQYLLLKKKLTNFQNCQQKVNEVKSIVNKVCKVDSSALTLEIEILTKSYDTLHCKVVKKRTIEECSYRSFFVTFRRNEFA